MIKNEFQEFEIMKKILIKFKFSKPSGIKIKHFTWKEKCKSEIEILKETGRYRKPLGPILHVLFFATTLGLRFSIPQSAFVLFFASVLAVGTAGGGTYAVVKYLIKEEPEIEKPVVIEKKIVEVPTIQKKKPIKPIVKKPVLGIVPFYLESTTPEKDKAFIQTVRNKINNELIKLKGKSFSKVTSNKDRSIKFIVTGSVVKVGDSITVDIKTIDISNNNRTIFNTLEVDTANNLNKVCQNIAQKIAKRKEIK